MYPQIKEMQARLTAVLSVMEQEDTKCSHTD